MASVGAREKKYFALSQSFVRMKHVCKCIGMRWLHIAKVCLIRPDTIQLQGTAKSSDQSLGKVQGSADILNLSYFSLACSPEEVFILCTVQLYLRLFLFHSTFLTDDDDDE